MTVTCVVQARTGSTRLPGKVLADLAGRPLLGFLLDRLVRLRVDNLVVATSDLPQDDSVADVARSRSVAVVRGSEADVLDRFVLALDAFPADVVVRVTADCPLSDPAIIEAAIGQRAATGADYTSNSLLRTFPVGLDVEVVRADAVREAGAEAVDAAEREHVMPFVYRRPERYRLAALRTADCLAARRWTVDTPADLDRVRAIVAALDDPVAATWRDMLAVDSHDPAAATGAPELVPATVADNLVIERMAGDPGTERLGAGDPILPAGDDAHGPTRTWLVRADHDILGWVQISVESGVGRLCGGADPGQSAAVLETVLQYLKTDVQVRRWSPDPWLTA